MRPLTSEFSPRRTELERQKPPAPWWVRYGRIGLPTRRSAMAFVWLSILFAVAGTVAGFFFPPAWLGISFLVVAWGYWDCIRWVDRHDQWG